MPDGTAVTNKTLFSRETAVSTAIHAPLSVVWTLLTTAPDYARWNSTVVSLDGNIREGGKIALTSTLAPKRTFKLAVKEFSPERRLVWGDRMGERVFTLEPVDGGTRFSMREKIGGPIFPLFSRFIPDFDASFEQFARDLKTEAERVAR